VSLFAPTVPLAFHESAMAAERARYDALLDKYQSLKMAGAADVLRNEPCLPSPTAPLPRQESDDMLAMIDMIASGNLQMRKRMLRQLAFDRAAHVDEETIRNAIANGVSGNGVPA
jgi:hypothetical protein